MVGMSAKLEVDAVLLCLFQVVRLVVEEDGELLVCLLVGKRSQAFAFLRLSDDFRNGLAMRVGLVVTSDDGDVANSRHAVTKQVDTCLPIEFSGLGFATVVLMIA